MGSAASACSPSGSEAVQAIKTLSTQALARGGADRDLDLDEAIDKAKQPSLSYMSCSDVFLKGNSYGTEIMRRKVAGGFPLGKVPSPYWIWEQMKMEWCDPMSLAIPEKHNEDYGTEETLAGDKQAYDYCTTAVPEDPEKRRDNWNLIRDTGNEGLTLEGFLEKDIAKKAKLDKTEVLSLRLYTGPGYTSLNSSLRKLGMRFAVTMRVISITIIKIVDAIGRAPRCFRGMSLTLEESYLAYYHKLTEEMVTVSSVEEQAPKEAPKKGLLGGLMKGAQKVAGALEEGKKFVKHNWERGEGFFGPVPFDPAPLSFTTLYDKAKGFTYKKEHGIILSFMEYSLCREETPTLKIGMGAPISWCSQYPTEAEVLFPPFTAMLPYALEQRDLRNIMKKESREQVLEMAKTKNQFVFMPVTYCTWNTQWDFVDGRGKQKERSKSPLPARPTD
eukprot:Hpha_TRINITY_DN12578_c0_g1::TRINITY_DN12578_c0_g1_i1::g.51055::m.51055